MRDKKENIVLYSNIEMRIEINSQKLNKKEMIEKMSKHIEKVMNI